MDTRDETARDDVPGDEGPDPERVSAHRFITDVKVVEVRRSGQGAETDREGPRRTGGSG